MLRDDLIRIASQKPALRAYLVPLLRQARTKPVSAEWRSFGIIPGRRKNLQRVLSVLEVMNVNDLMILRPSDEGYDDVVRQLESQSSRPVKARGMNGRLYMSRMMNLFRGQVMGLGEVILANRRHPFVR